MSLPVQIEVKSHSGNIRQKRTAAYYPTGKLRQLELHNNTGNNALFDFTYDGYGNLAGSIQPENINGQRLSFSYQYDNQVHTYPVRVENTSLGYFSTAGYDLRFGKPTVTTDINGNEMRYQYDCMGRNTHIIAPYEIAAGKPYTIKMEYHPKFFGKATLASGGNGQNYAITYHYDPMHPNNPIRTVILTDGLGRMLQTRKDAEINGEEKFIVTGKVVYDCFGRTVEQYQPFPHDTLNLNIYLPDCDTSRRTVCEYDILDRQIHTTVHPYGYTTDIEYGFGSVGNKSCFKTITTDAMGNADTVLKGTIGQQLEQRSPMGAVTRFVYDHLGQLKQTTDPDGFSTYYDYDWFGQLTHRHHPDAGNDWYKYDAMGNMVCHVNALGDSVKNRYYFSLLTDVEFPRYPANNVHYQYGTASDVAINAVGKIKFQEDGSGWQTFKYGKLGEVIENIRTFALPFENQPYTFKMQYEYDSWNRIQKMTYPDGEEVYYEYNLGGMLEKMSGNKNGVQYTYIDSIAYNEFELKKMVFYGNGTLTFYRYDVLQRLSHLRSECADGVMQDIYYDYDDVSNITSIGNQAGMLSNGLGGNYSNRYRYDNLYRLVHSDGEWNGERYIHYDMNISYSKNGRLKNKSLASETWLDGNFTPIHYDNNYSYDENHQPNTVRGIDGSHHHEMQWDVKGNLVRHRNHHAGYDRRLCWDEQNRLQGVKDDEALSFYMYDANGDRVYKLAQDLHRQNQSGRWRVYHNMLKPTLYASPYVVCSRTGYTKHYYAESERIASRIGGGGLHDLDKIGDEKMFLDHCNRANMLFHRVQECMEAAMETEESPLHHLYDWREINEDENRCYWYHTDHLGSSSWITYTDGTAVEHLHYLPWGEDLVRQRHTNYHARYTFSGKEKDAETGYSYFGSRYYSSYLSIWLSVDPMAHKYPSLSPYVYCANNPIKLVDPNGEEYGEYRDWNGNLLGTDGIDDLNVFFVSDKNSIDIIRNNDVSGKTTNRSDVKIDWETNKIVTQTIVSVYDMTINNGGNREEAATFSDKNRLPKFYPTGGDNGEIEINYKGYLSIHSHKLNFFDCPDGTGTCVQTPHNLSDKDKAVFPNYKYNVVVGNSYQSVTNFSTGTVYEKRFGTAVIYNSGKNKVGEISINNLRKIKYF